MYDDLWNSSAFDLVEMTNAINLLPRMLGDIATILNFVETPVYTNEFALDVTKVGQVELIPSSDLGSPGDLMEDWEQSAALKFSIPSFTRRASLRNFEVQGARVPGARTMKILETERNKKLARLKLQFDATKAHQRWTSLFGQVVDCDGKLLLDTVKQLGLKRYKRTIEFSNPKKSINSQLVQLKVEIERILGFKPTRYKWIVCEGPHARLREHPEFLEKITKAESNYLNRIDGRDVTVFFAGNVEVVHFTSPHVDETKMLLVPEFPDWARTHNGPSVSSDFEGNVLPYYVQRKLLDYNEGVEFKGSMRTITYTTRPDSIIEIEFDA